MPRINKTQTFADGPPNVNLVTVAETVIATLANVNMDRPDGQILLEGEAAVTAGAGTTSVTLRVRRGAGVGGALVDATAPQALAAGAQGTVSIQAIDTPGVELASQSYVLTVQQTAATGNGTAVSSSLSATF